MTKKISRRQLLKLLAGALGALGLGKVVQSGIRGEPGTDLEPQSYLPFVKSDRAPTPTPTSTPTATATPTETTPPEPTVSESPSATHTPTDTPTATSTAETTPTHTPTATTTPTETAATVIHVHDPAATSWNSGADYWNYINQDVVNAMMDVGLCQLTGTSTPAQAWQALLPAYQVGQKIAVKVNFNHSWETCADVSGKIDALIQPVNALVRSLKTRGVAESDVWVYDATRFIPDRFTNGCLYPGIHFFDRRCREEATFSSNDPDAVVTFSPPAGVPSPTTNKISDVLINATYLINMPILKIHASTGVTLGFKNHLGTINVPSGFHEYICLDGGYFRTDYNPLVDLYLNPHIVDKTVLTVGDGLIGARRWSWPDTSWATFGGTVPNSLFFATDRVALDCVMCDILSAETSVPSEAANYLALADQAGLGTYERGDPWGSGYGVIDYLRITP